jgi:hypothetical protein
MKYLLLPVAFLAALFVSFFATFILGDTEDDQLSE